MSEGVIQEAQDFLRLSTEAESNNRAEALEDLKFVSGEQWPADLQNSRMLEARPCLTINKLDSFCRQVSNQQRQQRPRMKVHPTNGIATKKIADVITGLLRHIEVRSNADTAYDTAFDLAVKMGWGYWRVMVDWTREDSNDQEILIGQIDNPFTVYFDPNSVQPDGSDAEQCLVTDVMSKEAFKRMYPGRDDGSNFDSRGAGDSNAEWVTKEDVRVAEYFKVDKIKAQLLTLTDGTIMYADELPKYKELLVKMGVGVKGDGRSSYKRKVKWSKVTAMETLAERDWPGRWIPIIPVYGNVLVLDGKRKKFGMVRFGKDPQRMINYWETAATESIALAPKAKWLIAEGQDEGHENEFARANQSATATLRYAPVLGPDGQPLPPPERLQPEPPPVGILQALQVSTANLREVLGVVDPAMRVSGNVSGKALNAEKQQSDLSTFHFYDNLTRSIAFTGRQCLDLIPKVLNEQQVMRTIGEDGRPDLITINKRKTTPEGEVIENNVTVGEYDVVMDTGPGYNSKRIEAVEAMTPLMGNEMLMEKIGDLYFRNTDFPGSEVIADRLAAANPLAQIDEKSEVPPAAQMKMKQQETVIQGLQQQLQAAGLEIKYKKEIEGMRQEGETKRHLMTETTKAHGIEQQTETQRADTAMQVHADAQGKAADYQKAMDVEELRAHLALLLARISERSEKAAAEESVENAV